MWDQELEHLRAFNDLLLRHDARPTVLQPLCNAGGWVLGAITALMGPSSAMACTEAVESVIGAHYNEQLRTLVEDSSSSFIDRPEIKELCKVISKCRDEELEHLNTAVDHDAHNVQSALLCGCTLLLISKV